MPMVRETAVGPAVNVAACFCSYPEPGNCRATATAIAGYAVIWIAYLVQAFPKTSHSIALGSRSAREGVTTVIEEEGPTLVP